LLKEKEIPYRYRDYRDEPLSATEIRAVLEKLGVGPVDVLRRSDAAFKKLGLTGNESAARLVKLMAGNPTLLQRPIGVHGKKAVVGRPAENLLELA
jgi:arsenate reductase